MKPKISIIIPIYNRAKLIEETLDSILAQTYQNWECIIVDDWSEDDSIKIINEFIENDPRFRLFVRPNYKIKGANSCRNYGREKANGEYIHWFDSDDIAHPKYLEVSYNLLNNSEYDFCRFSRSVFWGDFSYKFKKISEEFETKKIGSTHIEALLKNELVFNTCNVLWKKASLKNEFFNEDIVYADEWEYYSRLLSNNLIGISIDSELFFGRKHPDSTTYEFANKDETRRKSKVMAVKLVTDNLIQKGLLTKGIIKYFIQLGFMFQDPEIIKFVLNKSNASLINKTKYNLGYHIYPFIKPLFNLKAKLLKS